MTPRSLVLCNAFSFIVLFGCNLPSTRTQERVPDSGSVGFAIERLQGESSAQRWLATYTSQGGLPPPRCAFRRFLSSPLHSLHLLLENAFGILGYCCPPVKPSKNVTLA